MIPTESFKPQSYSRNITKVTVYTMNGCNTIASKNFAHDCRLTKQRIRFKFF